MSFVHSERLAGFVLLAFVILANAAGNVLLKIGAGPHANRAVLGFISWQTAVGVACFGLSVIAYAWALKHIELHVAQIVVSLQYISVIALSVLLLGEQISMQQWCGIALICAGLFVCFR
ncbi:MAG TPA: EamA family transporter [Rudaea sp.]|nr:EamA family transporter [Rudaea sp.]